MHVPPLALPDAIEQALVMYQEAATYCHSVKDYVSRDLFEELMHDEEEHIDFLETQLDLVGRSSALNSMPNTTSESQTETDARFGQIIERADSENLGRF